MGLTLFILFGIAVGVAASVAINAGRNLYGDVTLAVAGAVIGGFVMDYSTQSTLGTVTLYSFFVALIGAAGLVLFVQKVTR